MGIAELLREASNQGITSTLGGLLISMPITVLSLSLPFPFSIYSEMIIIWF